MGCRSIFQSHARRAGRTLGTYQYDGRHHRVVATVGSTTTHDYFNDNWQVIEQRKGSSPDSSAQFVWSAAYIDALVQEKRDTDANGSLDRTLWVTHDANFNITAAVQTNGIAGQRYLYDPYGLRSILNANWQPPGGTPTALLQHGHQGGRYDTETGLMLFRHRYLDVYMQRWISRDPAGYVDGGNLYQPYSLTPTNRLDYSGLADYDLDSQGFHVRFTKSLTTRIVILDDGSWYVDQKAGHPLSPKDKERAEELFERLLQDRDEQRKMRSRIADQWEKFRNKEFVRTAGRNLRRACQAFVAVVVVKQTYDLLVSENPTETIKGFAEEGAAAAAAGVAGIYVTGGTFTISAAGIGTAAAVGGLMMMAAGAGWTAGSVIGNITVGDDTIVGHIGNSLVVSGLYGAFDYDAIKEALGNRKGWFWPVGRNGLLPDNF